MYIQIKHIKTAFSIVWLLSAYSGFAQLDYYWVGGPGLWSDYANHWATSSGGRQFHTSMPTRDSDVFFDENSFHQLGEKIKIDCQAECHSFIDTAALSYLLNIQSTLSIYHDFILNSSTDLIGGVIFLNGENSRLLIDGKNHPYVVMIGRGFGTSVVSTFPGQTSRQQQDDTMIEMNDFNRKSPIIYPNPGTDFLDVKGDYHVLDILDNSGKVIKRDVIGHQIDVSDLLPGTYIFEVIDLNGMRHTFRFIKNND